MKDLISVSVTTNERDVIYSQIRLQQDQHLQQGNRRSQAGIPVGEEIDLRGVLAEKRSRESHSGIYPTSSFREAYRARPSSTVLRAFTSKNYQIANEPTHNVTVDGVRQEQNQLIKLDSACEVKWRGTYGKKKTYLIDDNEKDG
ncbi:hypothetical protein H4Q26_009990 [Puccinia striiformis f. sp. tritici PST-130]|nr:hypothetical protein H4Q26_009990 [Puccinia striiformis f. sp. tritici PST-130]